MDKVGKLLRNCKYKDLENLCLPLIYETKQMWEQ